MISRPAVRRIAPRALVAAAAFAVVVLALGCGDKDPVKPKPPGGPHYTYLEPISPENVLLNLVSAYNNRDSVETKVVYHYLYEGTSNDPSQNPTVRTFTRADEVQHVKRLHDDANIVSVQLDLGPPSTWHPMPGLVTDPPGSIIIPIQYFTLNVNDVSSASYSMKPVTMEYAFNPTETAPGDTIWTVLRWTETAN